MNLSYKVLQKHDARKTLFLAPLGPIMYDMVYKHTKSSTCISYTLETLDRQGEIAPN